LIEQGHSIIVIEHNTDVIKSADWVIDLGPEAGDGGGDVVYTGVPKGLSGNKKSHTGKFF
jgi:excinuclease ABC subunit A